MAEFPVDEFPRIEPNPEPFPRAAAHRSRLMVMDDGQGVFVEEGGNPDGIPLVYLHGGPGGGLGRRGYVRNADPAAFRIIGFDQRGCGRSVPLATDPVHDLAANTTQRLIADMEAIRQDLGVDAWVVNAVSWGSTLALAYAQAHPERVLGVVLMAVTTTSRFEIDWITETVGALYPEQWEVFASHAEQGGVGYRRGEMRLVEAYRRLMASPEASVRRAASLAWAAWEDVHPSIGHGFAPNEVWQDDGYREPFVTLTTHYWTHDGFCDPPLLDRMDTLAGIPGVLIHGRLDVSGPARTAWLVHRAWPGSQLHVDETEGHGGLRMVALWRGANDALARHLRSH